MRFEQLQWESVVSVAVNVELPEIVDLTEKVTTPEAVEGPDAAEIVSLPPRLEVSVTVFPTDGFPPESFKVTVRVDVVNPIIGLLSDLMRSNVDWGYAGNSCDESHRCSLAQNNGISHIGRGKSR